MDAINDIQERRFACQIMIVAIIVVCAAWSLSACGSEPGIVEVDDEEPSPPQDSLLMKVLNLPLDSLAAPVQTFYSPGARERAELLQERLRAADAFFREHLDVEPQMRLAVLDEQHWSSIRPGPYGIPFVSDSPWVAVMPALLDKAVVAQIYSAAESALPADAAQALARVDVSYEEAVTQVVDLIGFHEVGHVYVRSLGFRPERTARWFEELLATYAAYSYLQEADPDAIIVWNSLSEAILNFVPPETRSLDDFNAIYIRGMGPATYGWFQSHFNLRDAAIVAERPHGSWFAELRAAGLTEGTQSLKTSVLLGRLDATFPDFTTWAFYSGLVFE